MRGSSCKALLFWIVGCYPVSRVSINLPRKYREEDISQYFVGKSKETVLTG